MSKYTTEIRFMRKSNFNFGLDLYPIFDETYRSKLNKKILDHYNFMEIGFETAELFKYYLNTKMNEIMPYYNELYKSQVLVLGGNIFNNVNMTENLERNQNSNSASNSSSESSGENKNKRVFQDTPQSELTMVDVESTKWATNFTADESNLNNNVSDTSSVNATANEDYIKTLIGNNGKKYSIELLADVRKNILNIDMMIINDLKELFMLLY